MGLGKQKHPIAEVQGMVLSQPSEGKTILDYFEALGLEMIRSGVSLNYEKETGV